jgi:hypothetical protein
VNARLITLRSEEMLFVTRNVSVLYVEEKENKDGDLHVFEVVNTDRDSAKKNTYINIDLVSTK